MKLTPLDFHMILIQLFLIFSHVLTEDEKSLPCKGITLSIPPKKIDYVDFLTQLELFYKER